MLAGFQACGELIPKLWRLVFVVPFKLGISWRKITFLGASRVLIAADASDERVEFAFPHDLLKGHSFEFVGDSDWIMSLVADGRRVGSASGTGVLVNFYNQVEVVFFDRPLAELEHFRKFVGRIDVKKRIWDVTAERFF